MYKGTCKRVTDSVLAGILTPFADMPFTGTLFADMTFTDMCFTC